MKYTINNLVMAHGTGHLFEQVGRPGVSEEPPGSQTKQICCCPHLLSDVYLG